MKWQNIHSVLSKKALSKQDVIYVLYIVLKGIHKYVCIYTHTHREIHRRIHNKTLEKYLKMLMVLAY